MYTLDITITHLLELQGFLCTDTATLGPHPHSNKPPCMHDHTQMTVYLLLVLKRLCTIIIIILILMCMIIIEKGSISIILLLQRQCYKILNIRTAPQGNSYSISYDISEVPYNNQMCYVYSSQNNI